MQKIIHKHKNRIVKNNLNFEQRNTLSKLVKLKITKNIRFSVSDKGGEFVVVNSSFDKELMELHLGNSTLYLRLQEDLTKKAEREINDTWKYISLRNMIDQKSADRLVSTHSICPVIYLLTKTHKFKTESLKQLEPRNVKVRPIISGCGGPADKVSWLIHKICVPLLKYVKAHLANTGELLDKLRSLKPDDLRNKIFFSLDVVSLYPSVDNMAAVDTLRHYLYQNRRNLNLYSLNISDIMLLTKTILKNSSFSWSGRYYRQRRGLAMGNRLAPILAILYMDRIENQAIYSDTSLSTKPYHRYIDDCITTAVDHNEARSIQDTLNAQDPSIKFEIELPDKDGFLPFLNTKIRVNCDGSLSTAWYTKPANKGIMIHGSSHHPKSTKLGAIQNTLNTISSISSDSNIQRTAEIEYRKRIIRNGYAANTITKTNQRSRRNKAAENGKPEACLAIPFISEDFTADVKRAIRRSGLNIKVIQRPGKSLKSILVQSRPYDNYCRDGEKCKLCKVSQRKNICFQRDLVYSVKCGLCDEKHGIYVGETSRPFAVRYNEHLRSARNPNAKSYQNMAFSKHYKNCHPGHTPKLIPTLLKKTKGTLERKIAEAFYIGKLHPDLNSKDELQEVKAFCV